MFKKTAKLVYPVIYLRDIVVFPEMIAPLFVGRTKSVNAIEKALKNNRKVVAITQRTANEDNPPTENLYRVGVVCNVIQLLRLPDGNVKALIEGQERVQITKFSEGEKLTEVEVKILPDVDSASNENTEVLTRTTLNQFSEYLKLNKRIPAQIISSLGEVTSPGKLAYAVASYLPSKISAKQKLLEELDSVKRLEDISKLIEAEITILNTESSIRGRLRNQVEKNQKEYYLNEQMKAIQNELGDDDAKDEMKELENKIKITKLSDEAREKAQSEFKKLKTMSPMSAEAAVIRNYLDWIISIPWANPSEIKTDITQAEKILERDHFGLEQVKERILEYLAVQARTGQMRGPILCLVGPPGVGKTSLAKSIAESTGREFAKISLGGMRDEAEIRGHRRTYLGSMPGKVIQSMKKTKHSNPLLLLDEIDKMSQDFRGDPASALLEVLDPEQNNKFNDHYMEVDYDLSDVMFIATANTYNLPRPLLDRMEIIKISGYTEEEKVEIARRYLVPKLLKSHGLKNEEWEINRDALLEVIRYYTREAGVRNLERELANLIRKAVKEIVGGKKTKISVTKKNLEKYAKVKKYSFGKKEESDLVGITNGLAYTETGGDILQIEAVAIPLAGDAGKGRARYTGNMEKVMQESIETAYSYVRSRCWDFGIRPEQHQSREIHIHVPEGGTPKDGPSAGVAMCTSIVSVLTGIPVRSNLAMTGEITLRGRVLPIGGLKEKLLAALRSGIEMVLIPVDNVKDLAEIPDNIKNKLEIIPVKTADEVLQHALTKKLQPISAELQNENISAPTHSVSIH